MNQRLPQFVLASASPARLQLLKTAGIPALAQPSHFDESRVQTRHPIELVEGLAARKAEVVAKTWSDPALILGCDSVLALDDAIYGKPANAADAIARWQTLRGRVGHLYTGHALIDGRTHQLLVRSQRTDVYFAAVSDRQIKAYVASQEPLNCAGCFALDGRGGLFIEKIEGCHSNVIGLSLPLLREMLAQLDIDVTEFWSTVDSQEAKGQT
ncbi:nucleoside triphosphate pyrophosphatase [Lyngbya confervoides]|uniref:Nucleoside triphosphate pyrophosphatase n=1 Tax=Lyngbya confervoides BDU141951 TaxID=1574623 RepID=A0ABD4SY30_9CYAN|nr:nucleoside triphosphate pyrophosphatase [Lyngbya confervoides]MCM1981391.1 Maf-like protein [Lyngbya confervoides BDU141951]